MNNEKVTSDWYKSVFLDSTLNKEDIAINSGLNIKTISNMFNSTKKEVVIDASNEHYDSLYTVIQSLVISTFRISPSHKFYFTFVFLVFID